jgi:hypothetical protein
LGGNGGKRKNNLSVQASTPDVMLNEGTITMPGSNTSAADRAAESSGAAAVIATGEMSDEHTRGSEQVHPFVEFVDLLSRFLLIASSRTLSSGDAFFVLNDLFGGEGLTLAPNSRLDKKAKNEIRIDISPLHLSVECSQFYDLFSTVQITQCKDRKQLVPIISFEIKVFTTFKFGRPMQDFLDLSSSSKFSNKNKNSDDDKRKRECMIISAAPENENYFQNSLFSFLFILLSSDPDKICKRSLTIVPGIT